MSLNALLSAMSRDFAANADPDILTVMKNSRQNLVDSGVHKEALGYGEKMNNFVLLDSSDTEFSSHDALKKGPLLLNWYRGIW